MVDLANLAYVCLGTSPVHECDRIGFLFALPNYCVKRSSKSFIPFRECGLGYQAQKIAYFP